MAHLSPQMQHRFLARLLSPEETLNVIRHLRECDGCREKLLVLRSNNPGSLLEKILPEAQAEEHSSADSLGAYLDDGLSHADKLDLEKHLRTCESCQKALEDLKSFREELLQAPAQEYSPLGTISGSAGSGPRKRSLRQEKLQFLFWFNQPFVLAGVAVVAALFVVLGIVIVRSPGMFGIATESGSQITVMDGGHRIVVSANGIINPPAGVSQDSLMVVNHLVTPILKDEPPPLSDTLKNDLGLLKRAPSTLLGPRSVTVPFQVLSPVRTFVESIRPTFKWTKAADATGYVVHVIADDPSQEEVATSPVNIPAMDATTCEWALSESIALRPGKRYRWYVTATINDQEVDAPGIEQAQAKFAVISEEDAGNLNALRKGAQGDRLINGLLNLNAGLLDAAQSDFDYLLADPGQTPAAKDFLNRMTAEIGRLKQI